MGMHAENDPQAARVRRFLTRASMQAALPYLVIGGLLGLGVLLAGRELEHHVGAIESWIAASGRWGIVAFVGLFVVASSILAPDSVLCLLAGALFGVNRGTAAVVAGSLLAASLQFLLSRRLLRARITRLIAARASLAAIQRAVTQREFRMQALLRLMPLNPATVNYLLGAAGVRFGGFLLASLAHVPILAIEVYFGHAGKHVARIAGAEKGTDRMHDLVLLGGVVVCVVALVLITRTARKALTAAVAEP